MSDTGVGTIALYTTAAANCSCTRKPAKYEEKEEPLSRPGQSSRRPAGNWGRITAMAEAAKQTTRERRKLPFHGGQITDGALGSPKLKENGHRGSTFAHEISGPCREAEHAGCSLNGHFGIPVDAHADGLVASAQVRKPSTRIDRFFGSHKFIPGRACDAVTRTRIPLMPIPLLLFHPAPHTP